MEEIKIILITLAILAPFVVFFIVKSNKFHSTLAARGLITATDPAVTIGKKKWSLSAGLIVLTADRLVIAYNKQEIVQLPYSEITHVIYEYNYTTGSMTGINLDIYTKIYSEPYRCIVGKPFDRNPVGSTFSVASRALAGSTVNATDISGPIVESLNTIGSALVSKNIPVQVAVPVQA